MSTFVIKCVFINGEEIYRMEKEDDDRSNEKIEFNINSYIVIGDNFEGAINQMKADEELLILDFYGLDNKMRPIIMIKKYFITENLEYDYIRLNEIEGQIYALFGDDNSEYLNKLIDQYSKMDVDDDDE